MVSQRTPDLAANGPSKAQRGVAKAGWDPEEGFFKYAIYFIAGYVALILLQFPQITDYLDNQGLDPSLAEFFMLIPTTLLSWALFQFNRRVTIYYVEPYLIRTSDPEGKLSREEYLGKCADYISGFVHYTIASSVIAYICWKYDLLPKIHGGSLDLTTDPSIRNRDFPWDLKMVFIFAFGHHTERLITHMLTKRHSPTYLSMLSHHITACGVMAMAYHMKYLHFGMPVMLLFDPSDALLQLSRILRETPFKRTNEAWFMFMVVVWLTNRIIGFFWEIIWPIILAYRRGKLPFYQAFPIAHMFYVFCLVLLCLLNVFWFYQIMKIVVSRIIKGKVKIDYEDRRSAEKSQEG